MPAIPKQKLIRFPENHNQLYKQKTRQLSITRPGRKGGFGLGPPPPKLIPVALSSIATPGASGSFYLKKNTIIQSNQSLTIQDGQILYLYSNNINQTPYSLTNYGTINIHNIKPGGVESGITALNSPYPFINTGTININGNFSSTLTGITNSGTINVQSNGSIIFSGNFTNTGAITNKSGIYIGYQGNGTLTNSGTIKNLKAGTFNAGTIVIGSAAIVNVSPAYNGTLINNGTITNQGTITKVPGFSTFTNNGTYNGPPPVS